MTFSVQEWENVIKAMPNVLGFSGYDGVELSLALEQLPPSDQAIVEVIAKKGRLQAALELGGDIEGTAEVIVRMRDILGRLRQEFENILRQLY